MKDGKKILRDAWNSHDGPIYEDMRQWVDPKHLRIAAAVLSVDEFYSGAERLI